MRHTTPSNYQNEFGRIAPSEKNVEGKAGKDKDADKVHNEYVNNGELTQSQLQRLFYRRQMLISKGRYHLNYMALLELSRQDSEFDAGSTGDILDLADRALLDDFVHDRTIGLRNYGEFDRPVHANIKSTYRYENFDPDAKDLLSSIESAEKRTGISKSYLVDLAYKESSFGVHMEASTSSACGAYQFLNDTWLRMVKQCGAEIGLGHYADIIDTSGKYADVINEDFKQKILDLRFNHDVSSYMAARFTEGNKRSLESAFPGREISNTDLYMAHFLGAGDAISFIRQMEENPSQVAAGKFPRAANSNKWVFYNNNTGLSFDAVYSRFERDFEGNRPINTSILADRDHLKSVS